MLYEELGKENRQIIVMLHGAFFVHTFGRQYTLANKYHILVPHIAGFGNNTGKNFSTETAVNELYDFIYALGQKVTLIGFLWAHSSLMNWPADIRNYLNILFWSAHG